MNIGVCTVLHRAGHTKKIAHELLKRLDLLKIKTLPISINCLLDWINISLSDGLLCEWCLKTALINTFHQTQTNRHKS